MLKSLSIEHEIPGKLPAPRESGFSSVKVTRHQIRPLVWEATIPKVDLSPDHCVWTSEQSLEAFAWLSKYGDLGFGVRAQAHFAQPIGLTKFSVMKFLLPFFF